MNPRGTILGSFVLLIAFLIGPCSMKSIRDARTYQNRDNHWRKQKEINELRLRESDRIKSYLNTSIDPCEDFYEYACGNFVNTIDDFENETVSVFTEIVKKVNQRTAAILSDNSDGTKFIPDVERKIKDFYKSCIESSVEKNVEDARKHLQELGNFPLLNPNWSTSIHSVDWILLSAQVHLLGANSVIIDEIGRSPNRNENVLFVGPQEPKDITYEDVESESKFIYEGFISRRESVFLAIINDTEAVKEAVEELYHFETGRVKIFGTDYHDFEQDYEEVDYGTFRERFPENDWDKFIEIILGRTIADSSKIVIRYSQFLRPVIDYLTRSDPKVIANFMLHEILDTTLVSYLTAEPSAETCSEEVENSLHHILSSIFIRDYFDQESREHVAEIVKYLKDSTRNLIRNAEWLDEESRAEAEEKLSGMKLLNGYIDEVIQPNWLEKNFKNLQITPNDFIRNLISVRQYITRMKEVLLGKSQDILSKYYLNFYKFNAFYYYGVNVLAIPLGFQNLPIYHPHMPKSYNFGSFGSFAGHEITHAFDSGGRKYDAEGNVRNWWSNSSIGAFMKASQCFVDKFSKYSFSDEMDAHIDGKVTLPENIADHGGVKESFYAYKKWLADNQRHVSDGSERLPDLDLTNLQLFFLSYAQFWCGYIDPSDYASEIRLDHSPGRFRVLGVLSNFEEFSKEFKCPIGSQMNPTEKCAVW